MQAFARKWPLPPLVLVSCHEDFVGVGMLEPQWVFETRPCCLSFLKAPRFGRCFLWKDLGTVQHLRWLAGWGHAVEGVAIGVVVGSG